jgi:cyclic pyranopterin phosphate synthase
MRFSHFDEKGKAKMVDVTGKAPSERQAVAEGSIFMSPGTLNLIRSKDIPKGDVTTVARIAGIMAAKKTWELIPMCHPLSITSVEIDISTDEDDRMNIMAKVKSVGQTGVEMEALTAVSVAALTIYDMCKAVDKEMTISDIVLVEKKGGKSGHFRRKSNDGQQKRPRRRAEGA